MSDENVIVLRQSAGAQKEELIAAAAITPGHLIYETTAGLAAVHASEGGVAERFFAEEDALQGNTIDDDYAADDPVQVHIAMPGDRIQAWLKAGETVTIGTNLVSAGDGTLINETTATTVTQRIAKAIETLDASAETEAVRIAVRVM